MFTPSLSYVSSDIAMPMLHTSSITQRIRPVVAMSCLIYCLGSYPLVTTLFLVLVLVSIAGLCVVLRSVVDSVARDFLAVNSSRFVSFRTESAPSTCRA
jgi:hypothetical protein